MTGLQRQLSALRSELKTARDASESSGNMDTDKVKGVQSHDNDADKTGSLWEQLTRANGEIKVLRSLVEKCRGDSALDQEAAKNAKEELADAIRRRSTLSNKCAHCRNKLMQWKPKGEICYQIQRA